MESNHLSLLETEEALIGQMTKPTAAVTEAIAQLEGDILLLGVGGKMGPTLAELLVRAVARRMQLGRRTRRVQALRSASGSHAAPA